MQTFTFKRVKRWQKPDEELKTFGKEPLVCAGITKSAELYDYSSPGAGRLARLVIHGEVDFGTHLELKPAAARELARRLLTFADEGEV